MRVWIVPALIVAIASLATLSAHEPKAVAKNYANFTIDPKPDVKPVPAPADAVIFPTFNLPPNPPQPLTTSPKLLGDMVYVIYSDKPFLVEPGVLGLVTITNEMGPLRIRAKFADGNGKLETRNITGKFITLVEASGVGTVDLIVFTDVTKAAVRKTIDVDNGQGPRPPPKPDPVPVPTPGAEFRVMIIYESSQALPSAQEAILTGKAIRDYLIAKTVPTTDGLKRGWYIADKDTDFSGESKVWRDKMAIPRDSIPWILISNSKSSYSGPLPANVNDTIQLLKKFGD